MTARWHPAMPMFSDAAEPTAGPAPVADTPPSMALPASKVSTSSAPLLDTAVPPARPQWAEPSAAAESLIAGVRPPLLPDLDAVPAEPQIAAEPVMRTTRLSAQRRIVGMEVFPAAGLHPGTTVDVRIDAGWLIVAATDTGAHRVDLRGRLLLPRRLCAQLAWPTGALLVLLAADGTLRINRVAHLLDAGESTTATTETMPVEISLPAPPPMGDRSTTGWS